MIISNESLLTFFWDTLYLVPDTGQVVRSSTNSQTLGNISSGNNFQSLRSHRRKSALAQLAQWVIFNNFQFYQHWNLWCLDSINFPQASYEVLYGEYMVKAGRGKEPPDKSTAAIMESILQVVHISLRGEFSFNLNRSLIFWSRKICLGIYSVILCTSTHIVVVFLLQTHLRIFSNKSVP